MKKFVFAVIILVSMFSILCTSCANTDVTAEEAEALLELGGSYQDLVDLLGPAPRDVGSGVIIEEWDLDDGVFLRVWVQKTGNSEDEWTIDQYEFSRESHA